MPANVGAYRTRFVRTQRWRVSSLCPLAKVGTIGTRCARLQLWAPLAVGVAACECWHLRPLRCVRFCHRLSPLRSPADAGTIGSRAARLQMRVLLVFIAPACECWYHWRSLCPHGHMGTIGLHCVERQVWALLVRVGSTGKRMCRLPLGHIPENKNLPRERDSPTNERCRRRRTNLLWRNNSFARGMLLGRRRVVLPKKDSVGEERCPCCGREGGGQCSSKERFFTKRKTRRPNKDSPNVERLWRRKCLRMMTDSQVEGGCPRIREKIRTPKKDRVVKAELICRRRILLPKKDPGQRKDLVTEEHFFC